MIENKWLYIASSCDMPDGPDANLPRIVVPYSDENSLVFQSMKLNLTVQGLNPRYVDVSGNNFAYDSLFRELWSEGKPFIIVEHDIFPWPGALEQLWKCECIWGAFSYYVFGQLRVQLGCTKFNPAALGRLPLPDQPTHWSRLDWVVITNLSKRWESGHLHNPPVAHLNYAHKRRGQVDHTPESVHSAFG